MAIRPETVEKVLLAADQPRDLAGVCAFYRRIATGDYHPASMLALHLEESRRMTLVSLAAGALHELDRMG